MNDLFKPTAVENYTTSFVTEVTGLLTTPINCNLTNGTCGDTFSTSTQNYSVSTVSYNTSFNDTGDWPADYSHLYPMFDWDLFVIIQGKREFAKRIWKHVAPTILFIGKFKWMLSVMVHHKRGNKALTYILLFLGTLW